MNAQLVLHVYRKRTSVEVVGDHGATPPAVQGYRENPHSKKAFFTRLLETAIPRRPRSAIYSVLGRSILPIRGFL